MMKIEKENIKPSIITTLYNLKEDLLNKGLSEDMIITLIHDKLPTSSKMGKGRIKAVLTAVLQLDNEINKNLERRNKRG
ncbi:MAG: hypothetical protein EAX96_20865 [Candidatus Lokiarchaeota archaeon]|nr:hypothetical protein [Candidatus Lokiarchaeota archaeon]